ncbi:MAG TPA: threonine--tRNA ligase [Steroidobacteraceae bacterium]|nr:threonine--tRNA ligase [Steroidobacteraceae bacterium]
MDDHDHRTLGPRLELFHQQEEAPGTAFWHPRGATLYGIIERYIRAEMRRGGFREVRTPQLVARALWERSGHWAKFAGNMFVFEDGERAYALKPMNCPGHVQVFRHGVRSYRDLPLRLSEFGACHRYEPSGALHGLMRARAFTQDDAHVFCLPEHVDGEVARFCALLRRVYARFGFDEFVVGFSTRPSVREGSDSAWDLAESRLAAAARHAGLSYREQPGEGAFYGPKLEFILLDRDGREWQCGTIQLDLVLPERLDAEYVDAEGRRARPWMIHHAVLGSIERFTAVLLEHHRGRLPFWLAPDQVAVAPVAEAHVSYARSVVEAFEAAGVRCVLLEPDESLGRRIVYAHERGIPVFATVGAREVSAGSVTLRERDGAQSVVAIAEAVSRLRARDGDDSSAVH